MSVYFTMLELHLYLSCIPISPFKQWETTLEQVQQRDHRAAHTKPVFS